MKTYLDQQPERGRLVSIEDWCSNNNIKIDKVKQWSLAYQFPLITIGNGILAYEKNLIESVQQTVEIAEVKISKRRAKSRELAATKRLAYEKYLDSLVKGDSGKKEKGEEYTKEEGGEVT